MCIPKIILLLTACVVIRVSSLLVCKCNQKDDITRGPAASEGCYLLFYQEQVLYRCVILCLLKKKKGSKLNGHHVAYELFAEVGCCLNTEV